jgi:flagellar biosynthesis GTPase FlhF
MKKSLKGDGNGGSCRHKLFKSEDKLSMGLSPQVRILLDSLEMDSPVGRENFDRVLRALTSKVDPSHRSDHFLERAVQLYLPVYFWCRSKLKDHDPSYPMFVGLNGPQGVGKTTLTEALCQCFEIDGEKAISLSIDDFYLRRDQQVALARCP